MRLPEDASYTLSPARGAYTPQVAPGRSRPIVRYSGQACARRRRPLLLKRQLIIGRRSRRRAPPLTTIDRFVLGSLALFVRPQRVAKLAAVLKPATLLRFHKRLMSPPVLVRRNPTQTWPDWANAGNHLGYPRDEAP